MKSFALLLAVSLPAIAAPTASPSPSPSPSPVPTATPTLRESVDSMDLPQIQKAIEVIQTQFLSPSSLDEEGKARALLEGTIQRLSPGVSIVPLGPAPTPAAPLPYLAEILDGRAGYIRLGSLDASTLSQMDTALASFSEKKLPAVILDLRAIPAGSEFDLAADFARRFCAKGKILFSVQKPSAKQERILSSDQDPLFKGMIVILTDADTSGAAEALAAALRIHASALIVGSDTAGAAVEFATFPLGKERLLRVAVARVVLPNNDTIFPVGLRPDIAVALPKNVQEEIFTATSQDGVSRFVFESERPRMNEAALMANTNPEIESSAATRTERNRPVLRDLVLQRAMDLVTAAEFFHTRR